MEVNPVNVRDAGEIERTVAAFAGAPNGGLMRDGERGRATLHRDLIITLAARHKLPAVYSERAQSRSQPFAHRHPVASLTLAACAPSLLGYGASLLRANLVLDLARSARGNSVADVLNSIAQCATLLHRTCLMLCALLVCQPGRRQAPHHSSQQRRPHDAPRSFHKREPPFAHKHPPGLAAYQALAPPHSNTKELLIVPQRAARHARNMIQLH